MDDQKDKDLSPAMVASETKPTKTWFIERGDGMIFACKESEAWELLKNRTNWMRNDFKIVGVSDGMTYAKSVSASRIKADSLRVEVDSLLPDVEKYKQTEKKLIYEDLVDPTDTSPATEADREKLSKVRSIIQKLEVTINAKRKELFEAEKNINQTAFNAELEVARGHIEYPSNQNVITPGASPMERAELVKMVSMRKG